MRCTIIYQHLPPACRPPLAHGDMLARNKRVANGKTPARQDAPWRAATPTGAYMLDKPGAHPPPAKTLYGAQPSSTNSLRKTANDAFSLHCTGHALQGPSIDTSFQLLLDPAPPVLKLLDKLRHRHSAARLDTVVNNGQLGLEVLYLRCHLCT